MLANYIKARKPLKFVSTYLQPVESEEQQVGLMLSRYTL